MARVFLTRLAEKQFSVLSPSDQATVGKKLFMLTDFPEAGVRLFDEWSGCRAIFSDHHRIIYHLPKKNEVEVLYIRPGKLG